MLIDGLNCWCKSLWIFLPTGAVGGGICLILVLITTTLLSRLYCVSKKKKQGLMIGYSINLHAPPYMHAVDISQVQREPQYSEVLPMEEQLKVSDCQAYGKLDEYRLNFHARNFY